MCKLIKDVKKFIFPYPLCLLTALALCVAGKCVFRSVVWELEQEQTLVWGQDEP